MSLPEFVAAADLRAVGLGHLLPEWRTSWVPSAALGGMRGEAGRRLTSLFAELKAGDPPEHCIPVEDCCAGALYECSNRSFNNAVYLGGGRFAWFRVKWGREFADVEPHAQLGGAAVPVRMLAMTPPGCELTAEGVEWFLRNWRKR